jgi:NADH dehydrogenase FAD-containing subunit
MNTIRKHVVIVGGGFGGLATAKKLSSTEFRALLDGRINLSAGPPAARP